MKRIVVTGPRNYPRNKRHRVDFFLSQVADKVGAFQMYVGDCPTGVDLYATEWANEVLQVAPLVFKADWAAVDRAAGPLRNARMVAAAGSGYCLGFPMPDQPNKGTRGCMDLAVKNGNFWVYELPWEGNTAKLVARPRT